MLRRPRFLDSILAENRQLNLLLGLESICPPDIGEKCFMTPPRLEEDVARKVVPSLKLGMTLPSCIGKVTCRQLTALVQVSKISIPLLNCLLRRVPVNLLVKVLSPVLSLFLTYDPNILRTILATCRLCLML